MPRRAAVEASATSEASDVDVVVDATRVIGALIAESLAGLEPAITTPQWRVLVLASEAGCNVSAVAADLDVHPSNATRLCDRLVSAGLVRRQRDAGDRRQVRLTLTPAGRRFFNKAMRARRRRVEQAMNRMTARRRAELSKALADFSHALVAEHGPERRSDPLS